MHMVVSVKGESDQANREYINTNSCCKTLIKELFNTIWNDQILCALLTCCKKDLRI